MILIGLSGYARSGKDTAAEVLVSEYGFTRIAFADKLREVLYKLDPVVGFQGNVFKMTIFPKRVSEVIDQYGWDGYKETEYGSEIRSLLQRLGTEAGRETLWDSIWVDATLNNLSPEGKYVVTDCRFPNEAQAILDKGGEVWRVSRRGVGPANTHASETSLDGWDFDKHLLNDSSREEFLTQVENKFYDWARAQEKKGIIRLSPFRSQSTKI
jgi:hypothetical protein